MTKTDARSIGAGGEEAYGDEARDEGKSEGEMRERESESEASFPLAACIIQKLAGLYTGLLLHVETN